MQTRNAASVLPEPVGAAISVCLPAATSRHPAACGSVGPPGKRRSNQVRTAGWNDSSTRSRYLRGPTFHGRSAVGRHRDSQHPSQPLSGSHPSGP